MRRLALICGFLPAIALAIAPAQLAAQEARQPGLNQREVHDPSSRNYLPLLPNQPLRQVPGPVIGSGHSGHAHHGFQYGGYWPGFGYGWYYPSYPYYIDSLGPYVLPPAYLPAETLFGPQPVQRFLGAGALPAPAPRVVLAPRARADAAPEEAPREPKVHVSNAETRARADRFIEFGNVQFGKQRYREALNRYRTAAQYAPDVAEAHLCEGFALAALGQYEAAARALRRGLRARADWTNSDFRLDLLYADARLAKTAHLETVAHAIEKNRKDLDAILVLAMHLFFDGQGDRAQAFFKRIDQLGGNEDRLLDSFLRPLAAAPAAPGNEAAGEKPRAIAKPPAGAEI